MYTIFDEEENKYMLVEEPDHSLTYTYADYLQWKFKERLELFQGKIFKMAAPTMNHQVVGASLFNRFYNHLKEKTCRVFIAPFDVRLSVHNRNNDHEITTVVQPDICIFCDPAKLDDRGACGAPDLAIETLSPGNRKEELHMKYEIYEEAGVNEYWIVDPKKKTVLVFLLQPDGKFAIPKIYTERDRLEARCVPGLLINVNEIFIP